MKFANIIREAGGSPDEFPIASALLVNLYDEKDREDTSDAVHYVQPLFEHNPKAKLDFFKLVAYLEQNPVNYVNVRIDATHVIINYKSANIKFFPRYAPLDPMDYMD